MSTPKTRAIVRLGHGLEYSIVIQRGNGRNAEFIAGVHFGRKQTRRDLRQWRDAIQRGIEPTIDFTGAVFRVPWKSWLGERLEKTMGMKQHEEVGLTLVATPVLREAVSKLEDMMELAAADMLMEPKGTKYNSDLWLLIGKLRGSLHTPNRENDMSDNDKAKIKEGTK